MNDKEIYKELWEAYTDSDKLDFLKSYISESIKYLDKNQDFRYDQLFLNREQLEILLKGLNEL